MWNKKPVTWYKDETIYVSVIFSWQLEETKNMLKQSSFFWKKAIVGGPAVKLNPGYFSGISYVKECENYQGAIFYQHPNINRTSSGCPRKCSFCLVSKLYDGVKENYHFRIPGRTIMIDDNFLATSTEHQSKVFDWLETQETLIDFNQGLDCRLFNDEHAKRFSRLKKKIIRFSFDGEYERESVTAAIETALKGGIKKKDIRIYVLIGHGEGKKKDWEKCLYVEKKIKVLALPMFFIALHAKNKDITPEQQKEGWTKEEKIKIMRYFYKHSGLPYQ